MFVIKRPSNCHKVNLNAKELVVSLIGWRRNILAVETLAFINGVDICVFIKHIFEEILGKHLPSISCFIDNKSLFEAVHSGRILQDKLLRVHIASAQRSIHNNDIIIK